MRFRKHFVKIRLKIENYCIFLEPLLLLRAAMSPWIVYCGFAEAPTFHLVLRFLSVLKISIFVVLLFFYKLNS